MMLIFKREGWLLETSCCGGWHAWVSDPSRTIRGYGKGETELEAMIAATEQAGDNPTKQYVFQRTCFVNCWEFRNDNSPKWRRHYRHFARQAIRELRYLMGRQVKHFEPSHYGHYGRGLA